MLTHESYMARAIELAEQGRGSVSPNPMVGCVLVKDGEIIGEGYHQKFGEAHAEVMAFRNAIKDPLDCTVYVNLEPCNIDYFWNMSIPMYMGPKAMLAPFSDDLETIDSDGDGIIAVSYTHLTLPTKRIV